MNRIRAGLAVAIVAALTGILGNTSISVRATQLHNTTAIPLAFSWARTWGGSAANAYANTHAVAVDGAGNLYVVGEFQGSVDFDPDPVNAEVHTSATGSIDAFLSKFNANGTFQWAKTWGGGSGRDVAYGVGVDSAGNLYVVGPYRFTVDFDPDPNHTENHTSNATGMNGSTPISENNIYLSKFTPSGAFMWVRTWGPALIAGKASFGAEGYTIAVDGNYLYVVGDFSGDQTDFNPWGAHDWHQNHLPSSGPIFFDAFLSKFDLDGNVQWTRTWGGEGYDDGPGVAIDATGNVYVAGMYASQTINFDPAGTSSGAGHPAHDSGTVVDVFLSKFDAGGNFQWVRTWGAQGTEEATGSVAVDGANNVYVAGRFASVNCDFNPGGTPDLHSTHNPAPPGATWQRQNEAWDSFLSKFDANGMFQWARTWGGNGQDNASVITDGADTVYASGWISDTVDFTLGSGVETHTAHGLHDAFFSQIDPSGTMQWVKTWGGSGNDDASVTVDAVGNVYAAGGFVGTVDFDPGSGVDTHSIAGASGAFVSRFLLVSHPVYLPLLHAGSQ